MPRCVSRECETSFTTRSDVQVARSLSPTFLACSLIPMENGGGVGRMSIFLATESRILAQFPLLPYLLWAGGRKGSRRRAEIHVFRPNRGFRRRSVGRKERRRRAEIHVLLTVSRMGRCSLPPKIRRRLRGVRNPFFIYRIADLARFPGPPDCPSAIGIFWRLSGAPGSWRRIRAHTTRAGKTPKATPMGRTRGSIICISQYPLFRVFHLFVSIFSILSKGFSLFDASIFSYIGDIFHLFYLLRIPTEGDSADVDPDGGREKDQERNGAYPGYLSGAVVSRLLFFVLAFVSRVGWFRKI